MATVTKFPQSNALITTGWTLPNNAHADDAAYATAAPAKNSSIITDYYNFAMDIPSDATINSITFEVQYKSSVTTSTGATLTLQSILNTTLMGSEITGSMNLADTIINGATSGTWTVAQLNDNTQAGGFKLRLSGKRTTSNTAVTWSVDYVKVTVDYTPAAYNKSGSCAVTAAASVTVVGNKTSSSAVSTSASNTFPVAGKKEATSSVSTSAATSVTVTGAKDTYTKSGSFAVTSAASAFAATYKASRDSPTTSSVSSVTVLGKKKGIDAVSTSASASTLSSGKKTGSNAISVSSSSDVISAGKKKGIGVGIISAQGTVIVAGRKQNSGQVVISNSSTVTIGGSRKAISAVSTSTSQSVIVYSRKNGASLVSLTSSASTIAVGQKNARSVVTTSASNTITVVGTAQELGDLDREGVFSVSAIANVAIFGKKTVNVVPLVTSSFSVLSTRSKRGKAQVSIGAIAQVGSSAVRSARVIVAMVSTYLVVNQGLKSIEVSVSLSGELIFTVLGFQGELVSIIISNGFKMVVDPIHSIPLVKDSTYHFPEGNVINHFSKEDRSCYFTIPTKQSYKI